jgi:threonine dehydratase
MQSSFKNDRDVDDILTVSDEELMQRMRFFAGRMQILIEPTGYPGFTPARRMKDALRGEQVGILIGGGKIDRAHLSGFMAA